MDVGFWMRSSASTSNTLHVLYTINSHTFCPRGLWLLTTVMMDLGRHRDSCVEGTGSMSVLVRDRPVSGARHSVLMKVPDRSLGTVLSLQQNSSTQLKSLTIDGIIVLALITFI